MTAWATNPGKVTEYFVKDVPASFVSSSRYLIPDRAEHFACFDVGAEKSSGTIEAAQGSGFLHDRPVVRASLVTGMAKPNRHRGRAIFVRAVIAK